MKSWDFRDFWLYFTRSWEFLKSGEVTSGTWQTDGQPPTRCGPQKAGMAVKWRLRCRLVVRISHLPCWAPQPRREMVNGAMEQCWAAKLCILRLGGQTRGRSSAICCWSGQSQRQEGMHGQTHEWIPDELWKFVLPEQHRVLLTSLLTPSTRYRYRVLAASLP